MAYKKASKIKRLILMFTNIQNFLENTCNKLAPRLNLRTRLMLWGLYITQTDSVTVVYIRTLVIRDNICTLFWITVILGPSQYISITIDFVQLCAVLRLIIIIFSHSLHVTLIVCWITFQFESLFGNKHVTSIWFFEHSTGFQNINQLHASGIFTLEQFKELSLNVLGIFSIYKADISPVLTSEQNLLVMCIMKQCHHRYNLM